MQPESKYIFGLVTTSIVILLLLAFCDFQKLEHIIKIKGLAIVLRIVLSLLALIGAILGALLVLIRLGFIDNFFKKDL